MKQQSSRAVKRRWDLWVAFAGVVLLFQPGLRCWKRCPLRACCSCQPWRSVAPPPSQPALPTHKQNRSLYSSQSFSALPLHHRSRKALLVSSSIPPLCIRSNSLSLLYFFLSLPLSLCYILHSTFTTNSTEPVASFPALATQASDLVCIVCSLHLSSLLMPSPAF